MGTNQATKKFTEDGEEEVPLDSPGGGVKAKL